MQESTRSARLPLLTIVAIALVGTLGYVAVYMQLLDRTTRPIVRADGLGYYSYLPAYVLQRDPTFRTFVENDLTLQSEFQTGFARQENTGNYLQRYPVGVAVMMSPFFLAGHGVAVIAGQQADGFSDIEQWATGAGALVYMTLGLVILSMTLRRYFGPIVVSATLLSLVFGTSLFHYVTFASAFSHGYSFFLVAALVELVHRWYPSPTLRSTLAMGAVIGLIVLVRQTNAVLLLFVPLFGICRPTDLRDRAAFIWRQRRQVALMAGTAALAFAPQLLIWHKATDRWFVDPYAGTNTALNLRRPKLFDTLFSFFPHGLLPWAPILVLPIVGGFLMWRYTREVAVSVGVVLVANLYVISSWSNWFYGGGYGHRAFIDSLPLVAFPMASVFAWAARWPLTRIAVAAVAVFACGVTTMLMLRYWQGRMDIRGATWEQYLDLLKTSL